MPEPSNNSDIVDVISQVHCADDLFEFESEKVCTSQVKGSLRRNIDFWKEIGTSRFILDVIENGYKLPFITRPDPVWLRNNRSSLSHQEFVSQAILELVDSNRVIECDAAPLVINPLSVSVQPNGKKRLILDLRHVNKCLRKDHVKYEDWKVALNYFTLDGFMLSFDLKSGYHHIEISEDHQTFLGFAWQAGHDSRRTHFYKFTVLPFGLSTAPRIFTKTLMPLVKFWRQQGICLALFLDDGWFIESNYSAACTLARQVYSDLKRSGFISNDEKSVWTPCQRITWLGLVWDSTRGTIELTDRRIEKILNTLEAIIERDFTVSARFLASLTGQIISTSAVVGNLCRILTRHCILFVACAQHWDETSRLDRYCIEELAFWQNNLKRVQARHCFLDSKPHRLVYSDASSTGCGAVVSLDKDHLCHKLWDPSEVGRSSTWRELQAIAFAVESFGPLLSGSHVKWFTDNQAAAKIVEIGSMKFDLHRLAIEIFQSCMSKNIKLDIEWIPRSENEKADAISRFLDTDDWQLSEEFFQMLENRWGPHTIDCFANYYNRKLARFFSRFWNPGACGIDFFVQDLEGENCLVVPPVVVLPRVFQSMCVQKAVGTVVAPVWPSASFWPLFHRKYSHYVKDHVLELGSVALRHGRNENSLLGSRSFTGQVMALRCDFRVT